MPCWRCRLAEQEAVASFSGRGASTAAAAEDLRTTDVVTPSTAAARSPYKAPGGRWSRFQTYSVWQVRGSSVRQLHGICTAAAGSSAGIPCSEGRVTRMHGKICMAAAVFPGVHYLQ